MRTEIYDCENANDNAGGDEQTTLDFSCDIVCNAGIPKENTQSRGCLCDAEREMQWQYYRTADNYCTSLATQLHALAYRNHREPNKRFLKTTNKSTSKFKLSST